MRQSKSTAGNEEKRGTGQSFITQSAPQTSAFGRRSEKRNKMRRSDDVRGNFVSKSSSSSVTAACCSSPRTLVCVVFRSTGRCHSGSSARSEFYAIAIHRFFYFRQFPMFQFMRLHSCNTGKYQPFSALILLHGRPQY